MTQIICISDTHGFHDRISVPDGDVLIHAGDFSGREGPVEVEAFLRWFSDQPHIHKVLIAGNHDFLFEREPQVAAELMARHAPGVTYLNDSGALIAGFRFWGSPVQPAFYDWAFNRQRGAEIQRHWDMIPTDTEILVTHGPPMGVLDAVVGGRSVGCTNLQRTIERLSKLRLHVFGHLHLDGGRQIKNRDAVFVNAAVCDEDYKVSRHPVVITLE